MAESPIVFRMTFGNPLRRPPQETPSGDPLRRPPQKTPSGEHLVSPSGDPLRRIIIDSGDCLRRTLRRAFVIPLKRAFNYPLRRPPSGESLLTPSKDPLRRAFVDSLRRIVISNFYYLCLSSRIHRTEMWLSGLRRWIE